MKKNLISSTFNTINQNNKQYVSKNLDISQQVFAILKEKGWTQKDLAKKLGKYESDVSRMLSGLQNLTLKTITKLETILETDIILTPLKAKQQFETVKYVPMKVEVKQNIDTNILDTSPGEWSQGTKFKIIA